MAGTRFDYRKKKRTDTIVNVAIGLVIVLIIIFSALIFLGSNDSEDVALDIGEETEESVETDSEESTVPDPIGDSEPAESDEEGTEDEALTEDEEGTEDDELETVPDGEWEPVGTNQSGEFSHDFTRGGTNWNEMERALRYAAGLGDDMILWRIENNGSTSAIGTVSAPDQQSNPYRIQIDWVDGQGWMPVTKEQLSSNPYR
ncbi:YrrS family protein [Bacillus sp. FJAT-45037]|uniref:YrrS family protein n=1 Tax=Bacillus sp. FJAT-45037 TaxID=2011007 RepID=UPI000C23A8F4|nr:YrrS family protein [Bacillus sp. FJAT-45037]